MANNLTIDTTKVNSKKEAEEKLREKTPPLFKYEADSKYSSKLWIFAAIAFAFCAVIYVMGLILPAAFLTAIALFLATVSGFIIFLLHRKMKKSNYILTEKEIDAIVENYKVDLINTFVGYDIDYDAHDIFSAAEKYRKQLEMDNGVGEELNENESLFTIFTKALNDSKKDRAKAKEEKKKDKQRRKEDKKFAKHQKKQQKD